METVGTTLWSALTYIAVLTLGLGLFISGLYMSVGKWWQERELQATLRYHKMCDESVCGYASPSYD